MSLPEPAPGKYFMPVWPRRRHFCLTGKPPSKTICGSAHANQHSREGYSSGQRGQTVNLLANAYVGSNPTPSTTGIVVKGCKVVEAGGCSSMVELQPSKLIAWVRFPSPAPVFGSEAGFSRGRGSAQAVCRVHAHLAQSVEHTLGKGEVAGSIPVVGTRLFFRHCRSRRCCFRCCFHCFGRQRPQIVFG